MDIEDVIEEKYTNWLNCETDELDLTIEEAKYILVNDKKQRYVDDLLEEAWKVVLSELEKKDKVINEIEDLCIRKSDDEGEEYGGVIIWNFAHKIMEIINKVEREGK